MVRTVEILQAPAVRVLLFVLLPLALWGSAAAQSGRSLIRDGNGAYRQNKFADAEVNYRKALEKDKELVQGPFNLGDALYKQGRFDEAAEQYRIAAAKERDPALRAQALHNIGNALLSAKKIPESIAAYESSLMLNPKDHDTKYNLEYAKAILKQQQQQQQQQKNQKKDNKQDQKKQDQQQQEQQKQDQQKQQEAQQKKQQISKQDAERILEALKNEEKDVQKKLVKKAPERVKVEKDW